MTRLLVTCLCLCLCLCLPGCPAGRTTARPPTTPPDALRVSPAGPALVLYLRCPSVHSKSATRSLLEPPPLQVEVRNNGAAEVAIDEITGFNLDLPDRVSQSSDANASFKLLRIGAPRGRQSYSCDEASPRTPPRLRLKPGGSYRTPVAVELAIEDGEYRAELTYRGLKAECRFKIVP